MTSMSVVNDTIFKAFVNLFDKCDVEKTNLVRKSDLVKIISSSVGNQNPNIEDLIISIIGHHDNDQFMAKNEFTSKIEKYINCNRECVEICKETVTDYTYHSPHHCLNSSDSSMNEKKRLEALCDDLTVQLQNAEEQNAKLRNENYRISSSYEKLITREKELQQLFEELQNDLLKRENRCSILKRRLADSEKVLEKEKEKCQELQDSVRKKSDDMSAVLVRLKTAQKENEELKKELVELEKRLELKEDEYISCHKKLTDLEISFESELIECLQKIDTLEKRNHSVETEMLQGLSQIQELTSLNKELEMKYRTLKDSTELNAGEHCSDSTLAEIESNQEPTEILDEEDEQLKTSIVDSGCYDSMLSLRDEMEAEGECFDNFVSFVECDDSELIDKINNQLKTIDSLTELIDKEKVNNKLNFDELENCKKDLIVYRNTIDVLKQEKQELEEQWRNDKLRLEEIISQTKIEAKKPNHQRKLTVAKRAPQLRYNIERQQMAIRELVEKISDKSIPGTIGVPEESSAVTNVKRTAPKTHVEEDCKQCITEENKFEILETGSCVPSKEKEIDDLPNSSKALVMYSSAVKDAKKNKSTRRSNDKASRLVTYSECLLHPLLLFVWLLLVLCVLLQWALRESAISCLPSPSHSHQTSSSAIIGQYICPYVSFKWNEPPPI